jgi:hypothetical protein
VRQGRKECEDPTPRLQGVIHHLVSIAIAEPAVRVAHQQPCNRGEGEQEDTPQLLGNPLSTPPVGKQERGQSGEAHSPARKGQGGQGSQAARGPTHEGKGKGGGGGLKRGEVTQKDSCCPPSHVPQIGDTRHSSRSTNATSLTGAGCSPGASHRCNIIHHKREGGTQG